MSGPVAYAVISGNTVLNVCLWDGVTPFDPGGSITALSSLPAGVSVGWTLSGGVWSAPAAVPQTAGLTFLQFMALFTPAEQAAIVQSTDTQLRLFLVMATGAGQIDLTNAEVVAGVSYLVALGILASSRPAEILAGFPPLS